MEMYNNHGISGCKVFDGEDLEYQDRIRLQQCQQRAWIEQQKYEHELKNQEEREEQRKYAEQTLAINRMRSMLEAEHEQKRRDMNVMQMEYNKKLAQMKRDREAKDSAPEEEPRECSFIFGEHYLKEKKQEEKDNVFEIIPTDENVTVHSYDNGNILFRQSNKSREFANDTLDDEDSKRFTTMGSIMHALFSQIHTYDDVEKTLRQFEFDGIIYDETLSPEQLKEQLKSKFDIPMVKDWFFLRPLEANRD